VRRGEHEAVGRDHHSAAPAVEDASAALSEGAHEFAFTTIFPRLARIRSTGQVLPALR